MQLLEGLLEVSLNKVLLRRVLRKRLVGGVPYIHTYIHTYIYIYMCVCEHAFNIISVSAPQSRSRLKPYY